MIKLPKILVFGYVMGASENTGADRRVYLNVVRDTTNIGIGDGAGSRLPVHCSGYSNGGANATSLPFSVLDSPSSTSAITYKVQIRDDTDGVCVNYAPSDSDNDTYPRGGSTITVMEIEG